VAVMKGAPIVGALVVALGVPGVAQGSSPRVLARLPEGTEIRSLQRDAQGRMFVLDASGTVTVLAPDGAALARWEEPETQVVVSPKGDVYAGDGESGVVHRSAYDGRPLTAIVTREGGISTLAFDPRGSILVNENRYGLDGTYRGPVLQAAD